MLTLKELQEIAREDVPELDWESITPEKWAQLQETEKLVRRNVATMENIYTRLSKGESLLYAGEPTSIPYPDMLEHLEHIRDELIASYRITLVYDTIRNVLAVTTI